MALYDSNLRMIRSNRQKSEQTKEKDHIQDRISPDPTDWRQSVEFLSGFCIGDDRNLMHPVPINFKSCRGCERKFWKGCQP